MDSSATELFDLIVKMYLTGANFIDNFLKNKVKMNKIGSIEKK